jgi:hypothetical protein
VIGMAQQIFKGTITFDALVSAEDEHEARLKLMNINKKIVCEKMRYSSCQVESNPYKVIDEQLEGE